MARRFNPYQFALYKRIDDILWLEWDPIGINSVAAARDEYYNYLFPLMQMISAGADEFKVSNYLYQCELVDMQLEGNKPHCDLIATLICEARDVISFTKRDSDETRESV